VAQQLIETVVDRFDRLDTLTPKKSLKMTPARRESLALCRHVMSQD
jgi:hypothetical protein